MSLFSYLQSKGSGGSPSLFALMSSQADEMDASARRLAAQGDSAASAMNAGAYDAAGGLGSALGSAFAAHRRSTGGSSPSQYALATPSAPSLPAPAAPRSAPPPVPQAAPPAPAMPGPDDIQRRLAYAQELGIPIEGKHKFNVGHALASFFGGAQIAQMYMAGEYNRAASLNAQGQANASRNKAGNAAMLHDLSVYSALRDGGQSKNDAIIAMTNLEALGQNFNTRFRTDDVAPGHTRRQPNLDGTVSSYTAPNLVQHGSAFQYVAPPEGISSTAGAPPLGDNGAGPPSGFGAVPPSAPRLPAPPDRTATLGSSGRQISMPGADDGEADAFVRQGVNAGASAEQITGALKRQFGYSDDVLGRVTQALGPAIQWKQQNPNAPYQAEITLGAPGAPAPRPALPAPPPGAPTFNAPRANVLAEGSLPTEAMAYADSLGLTRGSPEWLGAVKDGMLKANGPTAFRQDQQLQGQRLGVQMRGQDIDQGNNIRTTGTSAANNMRSTAASRYNRDHTPAATVMATNGNMASVYPDGHVVTMKNARPLSSTRSRGRLGGANPGGTDIVPGSTHVNPQTGQTIAYSTRAGGYIDTKTGQKVR